MVFEKGVKILRARYTLVEAGPSIGGGSEGWVAVDEFASRYLVKLWKYEGDTPDDVQRALWDSELRTLYRVGSSPGAEETLLVLRDAGVDREQKAFVMVLQAPGYQTLASALKDRSQHPWLTDRSMPARRDLWAVLGTLADGLRLLHEQHILHRNVSAETVFFSPDHGRSSLRLGGFEWSVRLGVPAAKEPPASWSSPPEFFEGRTEGYRPETDWWAFGLLAARCLLPLESYASNAPVERYKRVVRAIESASEISDAERALIMQLVAADSRERLSRGYEIETRIREITARLDRGSGVRTEDRPLVMVFNPNQMDLIDEVIAAGIEPNPNKPGQPYNPNDLQNVETIRNGIQNELSQAQLYAVPNERFFVLVGGRLVLRIAPDECVDEKGKSTRTWQLAFCIGTGELRWNEGGSQCVHLPRGQVAVRSVRDARKDRAIKQQAQSWELFLPKIDRPAQLRQHLARFHDFIRCTNQLELLIRDAEIFGYRVVSEQKSEGLHQIVVVEEPRERRTLANFAKLGDGGMAEFLHREVESGKLDCRLVGLTGPDEDGLAIGHMDKSEFWEVSEIEDERVVLRRSLPGAKARSPLAVGTLRSYGMFGQVALIKRRKKAIDRLEKHSYLLRSLSAPGQVYMDTGHASLPTPLPPDKVDQAKTAAIEDILRVRPIYALQGPPGTGKTTLVAHLLREILTDDKVAQVLITAQAHGAVDVLRDKVRNEAFRDVPEAEQPLAVRLGGVGENAADDEGSVERVSQSLLERAKDHLSLQATLKPVQRQWLEAVGMMIHALKKHAKDRDAADFCELVRRGANLTYCTTSSGDLEALADMVQSFDWSIIEEAGKAHGFDLALPLQAGHRWLLIGDQKQLPPYRFKDYRDGIDQLDAAVDALQRLPERGANLLDSEWIRTWRDKADPAKEEFKEYARSWLNVFERIFDSCSTSVDGSERLTIDEANGSAAGMLSGQHRMHPAIGELISGAYYKDRVKNCTVDPEGNPLARLVHSMTEPAGIAGKAIVWLDVPWCRISPHAAEQGPPGHPRYTNPAEVAILAEFLRRTGPPPSKKLELAVLSPYNHQVTLLNRQLGKTSFDALEPKQSQRGRRSDGTEARRRVAHTVDSFQGNQADVIAVSLVRNNQRNPGDGLGFLVEAPRLNVLLSRAEQLLILVGSWEFFCHQLSLVNISDTTNPLWHWRKVIDTLDTWFDSGRALRLSAPDSSGEHP